MILRISQLKNFLKDSRISNVTTPNMILTKILNIVTGLHVIGDISLLGIDAGLVVQYV